MYGLPETQSKHLKNLQTGISHANSGLYSKTPKLPTISWDIQIPASIGKHEALILPNLNLTVDNVVTLDGTSGDIEINLSDPNKNYFKAMVNGNTNFILVGDVPQQGYEFNLEIKFIQDPTYPSGAETQDRNTENNKPIITFPASVMMIPDIQNHAGSIEILKFSTLDRGANWAIINSEGILDAATLDNLQVNLQAATDFIAELLADPVGTLVELGTSISEAIAEAIPEEWQIWFDAWSSKAAAFLDNIKVGVQEGWAALNTWFTDWSGKASTFLGDIEAGIRAGWDGLNVWFNDWSGKASAFLGDIKAGIQAGWAELNTWFNDWSGKASMFLGNIEAGIKAGWAALNTWFTDWSGKASAWLGDISGGITKAFTDASEGLLAWTKNLRNGLDETVDGALVFAEGVGKNITDFLFGDGIFPSAFADSHAEGRIDAGLMDDGKIENKIEADLAAILAGINAALANGAQFVSSGLDSIITAFGNLFSGGTTEPSGGGTPPAPTTNLSSLTSAITWAGNAGGGGLNSIGFANHDFYIKFNNFNDNDPDKLILQFNQDDVYVDPHSIRFENDDMGNNKRDPSRGEIRYVDGTFKAKLKNDTIVDFANIGTGGGSTTPNTILPALTVTGPVSFNSSVIIGDSAADILTLISRVDIHSTVKFNGNILPHVNSVIQQTVAGGTGFDLGSTSYKWRALYSNHASISGNLAVGGFIYHTGNSLSFFNKGAVSEQHHVNNVNNNANAAVVRDSLQRVIQALQDYGLIRGDEPA